VFTRLNTAVVRAYAEGEHENGSNGKAGRFH
jgi:hypothetical protein